MPAHLLEPLDDLQRSAAEATRGPVAVLAVAGAGKTRAIAHRIAYAVATGDQPAEEGLALTYTAKAAFELRSRLANLGVAGVSVGTIHAVALRQLNHFWPTVVGGPLPTLIPNRESELTRILESLAPDSPAAELRQVRGEFEWAKASGLDLESYNALGRQLPGESQTLLTALWQQYEEQNLRLQRIDFDDVLSLLTGLLQSRPDAAQEVRRRYSWITVDEYQDFTPLQESLLRTWLGSRQEICVVGDASQAIYGFSGADASLLTTFASRFPNAAVVELDRTYRCSVEVADFAAGLLPAGGLRPRGTATGGVVRLEEWPDAEAETTAVVRRIAELLESGVDPRQIAVLFRVGGQMAAYEAALTSVSIPFASRGVVSREHPMVRKALHMLRATDANPQGEHLQAAVLGAVRAAGWDESDPDSAQWAAGSGMLALANDLLEADPDTHLATYTAELERRLTLLSPPPPLAVTLATMHSAKGLEWERVFLPELNDRLLPYPGVDEESERNLLYVAATRAKSGLHLSWARTDRRGRAVGLTSLLGTLPQGEFRTTVSRPAATGSTSAVPEDLAEPVARAAMCSNCGRGLGTAREQLLGRCRNCPSTADEELLARLRAWRQRTALDLGVPEPLLLSDARLEQLASQPPKDMAEFRTVIGGNPRLEDFAADLVRLLND